ncbi:RNA polymerase I-specific transcription initiation factor RRN3 [Basidiobolus meristosporus CBS 931.73]|uniref:RNA polymerase I-specific transcription initiation factor RRN3 n=1 Tax=Basidiobolus meristosporus CBS 931.73 TaxID=1314790 RepID=A0A1Y1XVD9_9FUNG|nr:RNA polymerase I-specific transcription initiation factor RRN3 [Basidiobolus meristosporus CBS 931.73]|eukprot:ORX89719.1 RNA polymerase I-specific transcription initiation factor RRN3 [Basidiobolus meristosporus CBS 931.73]
MMTTFIMNALKEKAAGNFGPYEDIIRQLSAKPSSLDAPSPTKLLQWIRALTKSVSSLNRDCHALIEAALSVDWPTKDDVFVQSYVHFLANLVSAHAFYIHPTVRMLGRHFTFRAGFESPVCNNVSAETYYERIHNATKTVMGLIPTGPTSLYPILIEMFPHKRQSIQSQTYYLKNIFRLLEYVPILRNQLLAVIVDRIIQIDVEIQVELEEMDDSDDDDEVFQLDMANNEFEDSDIDDSDDEDALPTVTAVNVKEMSAKLDSMLELIFQYIQLSHQSGDSEHIRDLFYVMLDIFDKTILQTFKSRYTQFLLFYISSLDESFPDIFLGTLASRIFDTSAPVVNRVSAASYISSYVSRAKFLDQTSVRTVVGLMTGFTETFADQYESTVSYPDAERFSVFYAVTQAILYVFCFRWKDLVDDTAENGIRQWHGGLGNFQRIIMSRFNPLKVCSPNVVKQFAHLSHELNLMYCYTVIEQNKRLYLPKKSTTVSKSASSNLPAQHQPSFHELETFFPFDPYSLPNSSRFVEEIYQEWQNEEMSDEESEAENEEEDEEMQAGFMAMSISPSPNLVEKAFNL